MYKVGVGETSTSPINKPPPVLRLEYTGRFATVHVGISGSHKEMMMVIIDDESGGVLKHTTPEIEEYPESYPYLICKTSSNFLQCVRSQRPDTFSGPRNKKKKGSRLT